MIIRVLPQLESRDAWIAFCRRELPYCLVETPACLVDFQSHFLQLTLFTTAPPVRYTLGSRHSMDPAWRLIKGCRWSLRALVDGLQSLDFGANVRDNELLGVHTDLSVRRSFPRDRHLQPPGCSEVLAPLRQQPAQWTPRHLRRLLAHQQYRDWRPEREEPGPGPEAVLLDLLEQGEHWQAQAAGPRLLLQRQQRPVASLIVELAPATAAPEQARPRLAAPLR